MEDFQEFGFQNSRPKKRPLQPRPAWVNVMPAAAKATANSAAKTTANAASSTATNAASNAASNSASNAAANPTSTARTASSPSVRQLSTANSDSTAQTASAPIVRELPAPDGEGVYAHIMQTMEEAMEEMEEEQQRRSRRIVPSDGRGVDGGGAGGAGRGGNPDTVEAIINATGSNRTTSIFGPIIVTGSRRVGDVRMSDSQLGRQRLLQVFAEGREGPNLAHAAGEAQKIMARIKTKEAIDGNLDFSSCGLAKIPLDAAATILTYSTMKILNVTDNRIDSLPKTLPQSKFFGKLEQLLASQNRLSRLPPTYHLFNHLKLIDISHNQFVSFPSALYEIRSLEQILASSNQIDEIDVDKLKNADNLKEIDLELNPIRSEILDKIESQVQFHILIRVTETNEEIIQEMD